MSPAYPGAAELVVSPLWPQMFAVALDFAPTGPVSWQDLTPHILPYGEVNVAGSGEGDFSDSASLRLLDTVLEFSHPYESGPLTARGVAIAWRTDPTWLIGVGVIAAPVTTSQPGDVLSVPVTLLVLADPSSEG